jgi:hypothetical protein
MPQSSACRTNFPLRALVFCALGFLAILLAPAANADTCTVTNTLDSGPGSLRQAVLDAAPGDTVLFDAAVFTIPLSIALNDPIIISKSLTIDGAASGSITPTIAGNLASRFMQVITGAVVTLNNLSIAHASWPSGGGVQNDGMLFMTNVTLSEQHYLEQWCRRRLHSGSCPILRLSSTEATTWRMPIPAA